jgi:hypothetical protein
MNVKKPDEKSDDFKFGEDEVNPDLILKEELQDNRIAKLGRRITILAVIVPCMIGAALFFFYLDLKKRVSLNQTAGTVSMENLSRDVQTRLNELITRVDQMETGYNERFGGLDKGMASFKEELGRTSGRLKPIEAAKADKKDLENLSKQVEALTARVTSLDESLTEKLFAMDAAIGQSENELLKIRADISTLVVNKIDRKVLDQELAEQQKRLATLSNELEKRLTALQGDIRKVDRDLQQTRQSIRTMTPPAPAPATGTGTPSGSGKIIEKDLQ